MEKTMEDEMETGIMENKMETIVIMGIVCACNLHQHRISLLCASRSILEVFTKQPDCKGS